MMDQNTQLIVEIQNAWRSRELVVFVGAGLSVGAGLPSWFELVKELAGQVGADMPPPQWASGDTLIDIVQRYVNERGKGNLIRFLQDRLDTGGRTPTAAHQLLARSGVDLVFTANYDDLLEQAYRDAGFQRRVIVHDSDIPFMRRGGKAVNVVKLYGDLDQPRTVTLAREDYERYFLERPELIKLFETELARSTLLYLGWSHLDPHFNLTFGQMLNRFGQMMRPGYSVMFDVSEAQQKELGRKGIHVVQLPSDGDRTQTLAHWLGIVFDGATSESSPQVGQQQPRPAPETSNRDGPGAPSPQDLVIIKDIVANLSDFETVGGRETMTILAGVEQAAATVDLSGGRSGAAGRLVVFLSKQGGGADDPNPLGRLLRYIIDLKDTSPAKKAILQDIIERYRL
jgi:hypothetical protein